MSDEKKQTQELTLDKAEKYFIDKMGIDPEELILIKRQIAPNITDSDLHYCLTVSKSLELNPIHREIYFVPRSSKTGNKINGKDEYATKHVPMVGRDGVRKIARKSGLVIMPNNRYELRNIPTLENGKWIEKQDLIGISELPAWALQGISKIADNVPFDAIIAREAFYSVSVQTTYDKDLGKHKPTSFWTKDPIGMVMKCAEFNLLKALFGLDGVHNVDASDDFNVDENTVIAATMEKFNKLLPQPTAQNWVEKLKSAAFDAGYPLNELDEACIKKFGKGITVITEDQAEQWLKEDLKV